VTTATERSRETWGATVAVVARFGLALVWTWSAVATLADPGGAVRAVRAYQLLPEALVAPAAWGLPVAQLALAVLLVLGVGTRPVGWVSAGLLVVLTAAVASAWARGIRIECGCFGGGGPADVDGWSLASVLLRDALFLGLALVVALVPSGSLRSRS
jgi:uncharacterized membrane protein YphA (DoxX/SURF4 family)